MDRVKTDNDKTSRLLAFAKQKFGALSELEREIFEAVADGRVADYSADWTEDREPADTPKWDAKLLLKADRITWLCTDSQASESVTHLGIRLGGVRITSKLELPFAKISFPLCFKNCAFPEGIDLHNADICELYLGGTFTGPIRADGLTVEHNVFMDDGFKAEGKVSLLGSEIGGVLQCNNACFLNPADVALSADDMKVQGTVFLSNGFEVRGGVRLVGARIGGNLECDGGHFITETGAATCFDGERALVEGHVFLRNGFKAEGKVSLLGARIGRSLDCENAHFKNPQEIALFADGLKASDVYLRNGFHAEGEVRLRGASINGSLDCDKGLFTNPDGHSLAADGINVEGSVFVGNGFHAEGELSLRGAKIGGQLDFSGGRVINKRRKAISADDMTVQGSVFLSHGFRAEGEVCLHGTTINGGLECQEGAFINPGEDAIAAYALKVGSGVFLCDKFSVEGNVCLSNATIHGQLVCTNIQSSENFMLDLRSARVGALWDDETGWPRSGKLLLHGLIYDQIGKRSSTDFKRRIEWIRLQPTELFRSQPYEQLAAVFRQEGQTEDAQKVLIAKAKDRARLTQLTWPEKCWYHAFGKIIGYGYRPWRAFWIGLTVIMLGWIVFGYGFRADIMTATQDRAYVGGSSGRTRRIAQDYPKFDPLLYSVDMFVPVVTLHQASYWLPDANRGDELFRTSRFALLTGSLLRYYLMLHIVMGWILTTLLIIGLTGLIRS